MLSVYHLLSYEKEENQWENDSNDDAVEDSRPDVKTSFCSWWWWKERKEGRVKFSAPSREPRRRQRWSIRRWLKRTLVFLFADKKNLWGTKSASSCGLRLQKYKKCKEKRAETSEKRPEERWMTDNRVEQTREEDENNCFFRKFRCLLTKRGIWVETERSFVLCSMTRVSFIEFIPGSASSVKSSSLPSSHLVCVSFCYITKRTGLLSFQSLIPVTKVSLFYLREQY